jgi:hypothetical protein
VSARSIEDFTSLEAGSIYTDKQADKLGLTIFRDDAIVVLKVGLAGVCDPSPGGEGGIHDDGGISENA